MIARKEKISYNIPPFSFYAAAFVDDAKTQGTRFSNTQHGAVYGSSRGQRRASALGASPPLQDAGAGSRSFQRQPGKLRRVESRVFAFNLRTLEVWFWEPLSIGYG